VDQTLLDGQVLIPDRMVVELDRSVEGTNLVERHGVTPHVCLFTP
jgi:hypothetical protein